MAAASTSAAPIPFARMESNAEAFGYLPKRLEVRDCGLFGRPRPHDPLLAIGLDRFDPIGVAKWNDPVGLHEARYGDDPIRGATPTNGQIEGIRRCRVGPGAQAPSLLADRRRSYAHADHGGLGRLAGNPCDWRSTACTSTQLIGVQTIWGYAQLDWESER